MAIRNLHKFSFNYKVCVGIAKMCLLASEAPPLLPVPGFSCTETEFFGRQATLEFKSPSILVWYWLVRPFIAFVRL